MPIGFRCQSCGTAQQVDDRFAGQFVPCPKCGMNTAVPKTSSSGSGVSAVVIIIVVSIVGGILALGCVGAILAALFIPAVGAARGAAQRMQCMNNLKQIGVAMHNYHDMYKSFPPAYIPDDNGTPMHSWRTLILPFVEQPGVYDSYAFNQPWNSASNQAVVQRPIMGYSCPSADNHSDAVTNYFLITGPGTAFNGSDAPTISQITDGTSNTILAVEVIGLDIDWAEPKDLTLDQFLNLFANGQNTPMSDHPMGFNCLLMDGAVFFVRYTADSETLRRMATPDDGNPVMIDF